MDQWWKNAVGYQIYPRSFKDSNGDGIGDLQVLRITVFKRTRGRFLWLNPIYTSPNVDNGYDIADYQGIQPNLVDGRFSRTFGPSASIRFEDYS